MIHQIFSPPVPKDGGFGHVESRIEKIALEWSPALDSDLSGIRRLCMHDRWDTHPPGPALGCGVPGGERASAGG